MNLIGKIFVSLITLMSVVFLSFSVVLYASHKNWKAAAEKVESQIKPVEDQRGVLITQKEDLVREIAEEKDAYLRTVAALKTRTDELRTENETLATRNKQLDDDLRKRNDVIATNSAMINEYRASIDSLSKDLASAQESRANYLRDLATTVNQMHENAAMIGDLEKKNKDLQEDFDKARAVLEMNNLTATPELYDRTPPFVVKATVRAVKDGPQKLVMISAGADDGLKSKHVLEVYRGSTYLGRIEVVTTESNQAVCKVLSQYQTGEIMEGDSVSSKIQEK